MEDETACPAVSDLVTTQCSTKHLSAPEEDLVPVGDIFF